MGETNGQESSVGEQKMYLKSQRSLDSLWKLCALAEQPHKHLRNINEALCLPVTFMPCLAASLKSLQAQVSPLLTNLGLSQTHQEFTSELHDDLTARGPI